MKEVWTKRVTTIIKEYEYNDKGQMIKEKQTVIETQAEESEQETQG